MPSKITMHKIQNTIAAGATTGNSYSKAIRGKILSVKLIYSNTTHGSSSDRDINIFEMNPEDPTAVGDALQEVLNVGTLGADPDADNTVYYPRRSCQDNTATDLVFIASGEIIPTEYVVFGRLNLAISAAAAGDITTAYIMVEEY